MSGLLTLAGRVDAVVVGASAGGVEALLSLLPALPDRSSVPVFVVLHIPRDRPSQLASVFQSRCVVRVEEALDKAPIEPGTVYVAPPDYHLLIDRGPSLALSDDELVHFSRPSIDVLFESAADAYGARLAGIILTGGNQDGADGLAAVRAGGGVTIVQDPKQATAPAMVEAALARGPADLVGGLADIARLLATLDQSSL